MRRRHALFICIFGIIMANLSVADDSPPQWRATWNHPTSGSPVVTYELSVATADSVVFQLQLPGSATSGSLAGDWQQPLISYVFTLRGVDALGRPGDPVSVPVPLHDPGPPGPCQGVSLARQ